MSVYCLAQLEHALNQIVNQAANTLLLEKSVGDYLQPILKDFI